MRQSIASIILDAGRDSPDSAAVIDHTGTLTREDLAHRALRLAHCLRSSGVRPDDTVTVSFPHRRDRETVIACCAVWIAGGRPLPLDPDLPGEQRRALLDLVAPAAALGPDPGDPSGPGASPVPLPDAAASSWKAVATSGSTGRPKVVAASAPALMDPDEPVASFLPTGGVQLVSAPLFRSAPFTYAFRGLFTGHTLVIHDGVSPEEWLDSMARHRITWTMTSPAFLHRLTGLPRDVRDAADLSRLDTLVHIGAPCPPALKREVIGWLGPGRVVEVYAGSESNGLSVIDGHDWLGHPGSVGTGSGGTRFAVRSPDGRDLHTGETGVVWMHRGEQASYRYIGASTRRDPDGWDTLGDLGYLDADGYLYLVDREADMVVRDGASVYPAQVEARALQHPGVQDAVAFGFPELHGPRLGVVVQTGSDPPEIAGADRTWAVDRPLRDAAGKTSRRRWAATLITPTTPLNPQETS
ncbi:MAG: AMP-binding protein [Corynebacterium sp.]|nr:AMP-binding protein [Corynebacterium sp.]